uniref:Coiled-coil domain-containing protein 178 isoform X3 n=1 Tax=Geotrypetes seraphini TaxID=260995 RepID=A0A6P8Q4I1_GEOSA|nr:coiled-coil domain-containing protein 178 isoform X3 [Geotrypetes seraphini]
MKQQREDTINKLKHLLKALNYKEFLGTKYDMKATNIEKEIKEKEIQYEVTLTRKAKLENGEESMNDKIKNLNYQANSRESENLNLVKSCSDIQQKYASNESYYNSQILNLEQDAEMKLQMVEQMQHRNEDLELENEDFEKNIEKRKKNIEEEDTEIQKLQEEIVEQEEQNKLKAEEVDKTSTALTECKAYLEETIENFMNEEKKFQNMTEMVKLEIVDEKAAALKAETLETLRMLKKKLDKKSKSIEQQLSETKDFLQKEFSDIQMKYEDVAKRLKNTIKDIGQFEIRISEVMESQKKIKNATNNKEAILRSSQQNLELVDRKHLNVRALVDMQKTATEKCMKIFQTQEGDHAKIRHDRQTDLENVTTDLKEIFEENLELADEYEALQNLWLTEKESLMEFFEKRVKMESNLHDMKQLSVLQSRMHRASVEYFKHQGLYNQAGLANFQAASHENAQKILAVQDEMSKTIQHISGFLDSLTDVSSSIGGEDNDEENK